MARYDGVRYGHRAAQYGDLNEMISRSRAEGFGDEVKRRILIGTYVLSHGYYDAYYLQAQRPVSYTHLLSQRVAPLLVSPKNSTPSSSTTPTT